MANNSLIPYIPQPKWKPNFKFRFKINQEHVSLWSFALLIFVASGTFWRYSRVEAVSAQPTATLISANTTVEAAVKGKYKSKNNAAPVSASELFSQEAKDYIAKYAGVAKQEQKAHGIPASISLAQGLIESRAGTSKLAKGNNNHFGMKCFSRNCKKGHCSNFTDDTHKDFFRKYKDPLDSWKDHSRMLSKGRYAKLKRFGTNYRDWSYGLKSIGYATDKAYAEKLIGVIEKYDLHKFD